MPTKTWDFPEVSVDYTASQRAEIEKLERDIKVQLRAKPHRLQHSLSVAKTAEYMATLYGVDPYPARVAGILHDWDKALTPGELIERATEQKVDLGVPLTKVVPLLHGIVAENDLRVRYPELTQAELQAVGRHTIGAFDMTPLDMIIFTADGIEPYRTAHPDIQHIREMVGKVTLPDLYWTSFTGGIVYVVRTGRYLYPGTVTIYNEMMEQRNQL